MTTLHHLVQSLPRELYDEIYELTFTKDNDIIHVNETYQPPSLLHVSRKTRQQFIESYYGDSSTFYVTHNCLTKWLWILDQGNIKTTSEIRMTGNPLQAEKSGTFALYDKLFAEKFKYTYMDDERYILKFEVMFGEPPKKLWLSSRDYVGDGTSVYYDRYTADVRCEEIYRESME